MSESRDDSLFFTHIREAIQILGPQRHMTKEESAAMNEMRMHEATPVKMLPVAEYEAMQAVIREARDYHGEINKRLGMCDLCDAFIHLDSLKSHVPDKKP